MSHILVSQVYNLALSENPVRRREPACPGKARDMKQVPAAMWRCISELCEGQRKWPLFIHGTTGTGKSSAALCVYDRVENADFYTMPELVSQVRSVNNGTAEWYKVGVGGTYTTKSWWSRIASLPLLVIDDVGLREVSSDFQMETLFLALEHREGKPLICTSNLNEEGIRQSYNERIHSRLCSGTMYKLSGRDRRFADEDL